MNREELLKNAKPILFNTEMVQAILEGRKTVTRRVVKYYSRTPTKDGKDKFYKIDENLNGTNPNRLYAGFYNNNDIFYIDGEKHIDALYYPLYFKVGDILYIRETWRDRWGVAYANYGTGNAYPIDDVREIEYKTCGNGYFMRGCNLCPNEPTVVWDKWSKWKPSIHMPKVAARIFLKVTDVRIERVKNITWEQTLAEGIEHDNVNKQEDILCEYCPIEKSQRGVKNYGNGPSFCIDSGMCEKAKLNFEDDCVDCFSELWDSTFSKYQLCRYGWETNPWVWVIEFERVEVENERN